jgi:hypothetical protein
MVRTTIWGAVGTAMVSGLLVLTATAASASPAPPPGGGPPSPPDGADFSALLSATTTGSAGYAYVYNTSTSGDASFTAFIISCDTAADGHHSWDELQVKDAGTSWSTPDPTKTTPTSNDDTSGTGTCSTTWKEDLDHSADILDLRVATYTMEGNTREDGPAYSSTYVVNPGPVSAVKGRVLSRQSAG